MQAYTVSQWLLFFYIYCFFGWVWECCYVSARKGKWVNRGFLHGPALPIYGSGAMVILVSTIGVRDNIALIFHFYSCPCRARCMVRGRLPRAMPWAMEIIGLSARIV